MIYYYKKKNLDKNYNQAAGNRVSKFETDPNYLRQADSLLLSKI